MTKQRIYEIIDATNKEDKIGIIYDTVMIITIILTLIPLGFKTEPDCFYIVDKICVIIFIIDYILRLYTADIRLEGMSKHPYLRYPFTFMAIVDLLSILPSISLIHKAFRLLRIFHMFQSLRVLRVFRIFRIARYSKSARVILEIFQHTKQTLSTVATFAIGYVIVTALAVFVVEPESFKNFPEAIYWASVSLTGVGYGDIVPVSTIGRVVTVLSVWFGVAIIALPSGVITAAYMHLLQTKYFDTAQEKKMDCYEEMKKVKELYDLGILNEAEFEKKKKELLDL